MLAINVTLRLNRPTIEATLSGGTPGPAGEGVPPGGLTNQVLTKNSDADFDTDWADGGGGGGGGSVTDATTLVKGIVKLAGDLAGTADSPTVPGLAGKVAVTRTVNGHPLSADVTVSKSDVGLPNADNTSDANKPVSTAQQAALDLKQSLSQKGTANGYAELDSSGFVPSAQLPSFVDDVIEAANFAALPATGTAGKIYVTLDNNLTYRWSGSAYVEISASLALGETSTTAYRGDRGKIAYDHSQLTSGNPHNVTKTDVGLSNVTNDAQLKAADLDTDGTLTANSDSKIASQKAVKTYVDTAVTGLLEFKGSTDASSNPNYPAASKGDAYVVSVAGKIGGASGKSVDVGDVYLATQDNAGGTEASVGTSWSVLEHNLVGALLSANNLSDLANVATARTNLGLGSIAVLAAPSGTVVGTTDAQTLTGKRITNRVTAFASSATPTIDTDAYDAVSITALATAITSMSTNLSGTPTNFQKLIIRIKDDGTARAITWGASFEAKGVALPTTTVISKVLTAVFVYDTVTSKWGCVAAVQEA